MNFLARLFSAICISTIFMIFILNYRISSRYKNIAIIIHEESRLSYMLNHEYLINGNVAQYSSYIIISGKDKTIFQIEVFIKLALSYNTEILNDLQMLRCLVKFLKNENNTIQLDPISSQALRSSDNYNKKLIYNCKLNYKNLELNDIVVAVILKSDFNIENVLPNSMVKYQMPTIIKTIEPRLQSVALCVHFTYAVPSQIFHWFSHQLSIGVNEIRIYDATENMQLTKILRNYYGVDERIVVVPYNIHFNKICNQTILFNEKDDMNKSCLEFYESQFADKIRHRDQHETLTANDCFSVLSKKHEFIGYYDLDEFVYPRRLDLYREYNRYSCNSDSQKSICSLNPFGIQESNNLFYNYLNELIEKYKNGKNKSDLRSIQFMHATTLPNLAERQLMMRIGHLIKQINSTNKFPIYLNLDNHLFEINYSDISYVQNLYEIYTNFISCAYKDYFNKIKTIDEIFKRYLYYVTELNERMHKSIHYYKNVNTMWVHHAKEHEKKSWAFWPSVFDGHFIKHYRENLKITKRVFTGTIRKLNIDFEYIFYLLKKYTSFCNVTLLLNEQDKKEK